MESFYNLLQEIRKKPTLYLSRYSIFDFQSFYFGYYIARHQAGILETEEELRFEEFLQWIRKLYEVESNQSWAMIILFNSYDERDALDRLFNLLFDDFLIEKTNSVD